MLFEHLQPLTKPNGFAEIQACDPVEVVSCEQQGRGTGKVIFFKGRVMHSNGQPIACSFATQGQPVPVGQLSCKCAVKSGQYGIEYTFWPSNKATAPSRPAPPQGGGQASNGRNESIERQCAFKGAIELAVHKIIEPTQIGSFTNAFAGLIAGEPLDVVSLLDPNYGGNGDVPF